MHCTRVFTGKPATLSQNPKRTRVYRAPHHARPPHRHMCSDKGAGVAQHGAADWSIDHCLHQRRLVGADAAEHPRAAHTSHACREPVQIGAQAEKLSSQRTTFFSSTPRASDVTIADRQLARGSKSPRKGADGPPMPSADLCGESAAGSALSDATDSATLTLPVDRRQSRRATPITRGSERRSLRMAVEQCGLRVTQVMRRDLEYLSCLSPRLEHANALRDQRTKCVDRGGLALGSVSASQISARQVCAMPAACGPCRSSFGRGHGRKGVARLAKGCKQLPKSPSTRSSLLFTLSIMHGVRTCAR